MTAEIKKHPLIIIKEIQKILDKHKDKIYVGNYLFIKEQLDKLKKRVSDQEDDIVSLNMQLAETTKPHCIQCDESSGHDSRGWMKLKRGFYLCAKCILEGEAVRDLKDHYNIK